MIILLLFFIHILFKIFIFQCYVQINFSFVIYKLTFLLNKFFVLTSATRNFFYKDQEIFTSCQNQKASFLV
jgi:hypothetical protein